MRVHSSQGGLAGFGSPDPSIPDRGAMAAKHRGRKNKKRRHGKKRGKK